MTPAWSVTGSSCPRYSDTAVAWSSDSVRVPFDDRGSTPNSPSTASRPARSDPAVKAKELPLPVVRKSVSSKVTGDSVVVNGCVLARSSMSTWPAVTLRSAIHSDGMPASSSGSAGASLGAGARSSRLIAPSGRWTSFT